MNKLHTPGMWSGAAVPARSLMMIFTSRLTVTLTPALTALSLAAAVGCSSLATHDEPGGIVVYDAGPPGSEPDAGIRQNKPVMKGEITPIYGFVDATNRVEYYYMGEVEARGGKVAAGEMYFFYDEDGKPLYRLSKDGERLVGWHPVVDTIPTRSDYSPFWRVVKVRVKGQGDKAAIDALKQAPAKKDTCQMDSNCGTGERCVEERCTEPIDIGIFKLDGIKSKKTLDDSQLITTATNLYLNCPVVDADAKLLKGISNPNRPFPKVQVWYRRLKAFCYLLEGGKDVFGARAADDLTTAGTAAFSRVPATAMEAFFVRQKLTFGSTTSQLVEPKRNMVITEFLPGKAGYSPLASEVSVIVGKDHKYKDITSVAEAKKQQKDGKVTIKSVGTLHNLVVRGTIPDCKTDKDCEGTGGKVDPPLQCSLESGYCSPPFVGLNEECRRDVKECDPKGGPPTTKYPEGSPLVCLRLTVREKYFCHNTCNVDNPDTDSAKDQDSRCGSVKNHQCYGYSTSDPNRPNGVCIHKCNSRVTNKEDLWHQCHSPTKKGHCPAGKPEFCCDSNKNKTCCGNGKLEYGEACDDGNNVNKDGCNEYCSLTTFVRCAEHSDCKAQGLDGKAQTCKKAAAAGTAKYCLQVEKKEKDESKEKGKYRKVCMSYDYCWPPDERADWLNTEEEEDTK